MSDYWPFQLRLSASSESPSCCSRRGVLGLGTALIAGGVTFAVRRDASAQQGALTKEQRDAMSPDEVIKRVLDGNERFVTNQRQPRDFLAEQRITAEEGQYPAAVILSCIDSRAPVEVILDIGIGSTFNARVAGNAVNDDILGSMEYATAVAGAKLVLVMGHTACGAIKGAIDNVHLGNLTLLLARFGNAIEATEIDGERSSKNPAFVTAVATTHVRHAIGLIRDRSPVLRDLEKQQRIKIIGSMYDVATGRVTRL